jgi:type 1 glutamine amidotransferase
VYEKVVLMMKILVLCADAWHTAQVPREGLGRLGENEFSFDWIEHAHAWSLEQMMNYPVTVLTKSNNVSAADKTGWVTGDVQAAFLDYVRAGNGLLAIHSGTADYEEMHVLRSLLGGVFRHHPEQCPVTMTPHPGHPLAEGSFPFTLRDEHYFMAMDDPGVDVFLTTGSEHGEQPGGWRRAEGKGRVAVLTPGHNLEVWLHPSYQALLRNALRWCGKQN